MRKALLLVLPLLLLIGGPAFAEHDPTLACNEDLDCFHSGCSGQVCANQPVITTCEFKCEYGCYAASACACFGVHCKFAHDMALHQCLRQCKTSARLEEGSISAELVPTAETKYFTYRAKLPSACALAAPAPRGTDIADSVLPALALRP